MFRTLRNIFRSKKNIIFIALDGVRLDRFRPFPHFSSLLKRGTLFSNMIAYSPHSIASFHAIFTGVYGTKSGVDSYFGTMNFQHDKCATLTEYLQEKGYYCLGDSMNDLVVPKKGFHKLVVQKAFSEFISSHKQLVEEVTEKNREGTPCFLHLHCSSLHNSVVEGVIKKFKGQEEEYAQSQEENELRYNNYLKEIDNYVRFVVQELEKYHLFDNSTVVFFSDHGNALGEKPGEVAYGVFCYDYSLRTFALFIDDIFPVQEIPQMIRNVDMLPTILEMRGIAPRRNALPLDGKSVLECVNGESTPRISFSETGGMTGPWPSPEKPNVHAVQTEQWKLIYNRTPQTFELYNLEQDPEENRNLYGRGYEKEQQLMDILQRQIGVSNRQENEAKEGTH